MASEELRIIITSTANTEGVQQAGSALLELYAKYQMIQQAVSMVTDTIEAAWSFMREAVREAGVRESFEALAASAGMSADSIMRVMNAAARGTVSAQTLILNANRLMIADIGATQEDMADLLALSTNRAQMLGLTTEEAYSRIVMAVTKGEIELLDELGIRVLLQDAYRREAEAQGVLVDQLTAQQRARALLNELMTQYSGEIEANRENTDSTTASMATLETAISNMTDAIQAFFAAAEGGSSVLDFLNQGFTALSQVAALSLAGVSSLSTFITTMRETGNNAQLAAAAAVVARDQAFIPMLEAMGQIGMGAADLQMSFRQLAIDIGTGAIGVEEFNTRWDELRDQVADPRVAAQLKLLQEALNDGRISAEQFAALAVEHLRNLNIAAVETAETVVEAVDSITNKLAGVGVKAEELVDPWRNALGGIDAEIVRSGEQAKEDADNARQAMLDAEERAAEDLVMIAQRRDDRLEDILRQTADKLEDAKNASARKSEDLETRTNDKLIDLMLELSNDRLDIEVEYWRAIRDIRDSSSVEEEEAIRRRDARALSQARRKRDEALEDATVAHRDELQDLERAEQRRRQVIQLENERERRDNQVALQRNLDDIRVWQQRMEDTTRQQANRDAQRRRAQYLSEEAELEAHWRNMVAIVEENAARMGKAAQRATTSIIVGARAGSANTSKVVSNGRTRTMSYTGVK